jgi:hypothetical protein
MEVRRVDGKELEGALEIWDNLVDAITKRLPGRKGGERRRASIRKDGHVSDPL